MKPDSQRYSYSITWSEDDQQFVGLCSEFPSLSWLSDTQEGALKGIAQTVQDVLVDMENDRELMPRPNISGRVHADEMRGSELQALRKLLMLDVREAAEEIGQVSARSWQYWESGRYQIPSDVAEKMWAAVEIYKHLKAQIDSLATKQTGFDMSYYTRFDEYLRDHPGKSIIDWRIEQAVASEAFSKGHVVIV
ncbi:protein of unknown function [Vreelandella subterranea]|uniref:Antitoxin HicB n=1 Tax=Vreelandella subterranea TaxID=416874 RepID=A0A1H9USB3_9GAMM|nr:DUF1870 family protein [Halomonas subterranea]SES12229.1 protein of unknown function [Halomonas subterranea]